MPDEAKTIFLVSPFVPFPPARGIELRIYRLLKWMKKAGYRVVLIVPTEHIDASALEQLKSITFAVHWTMLPFRTRLGARFPRLRRALWETSKPFLMHLSSKGRTLAADFNGSEAQKDSGLAGAMNSTRRLGDEQIKAWFAPDKLVALVAKHARRYQPDAAIVEYIFSAPVFAGLPSRTLKIVDTIDVFSRKEDQVLAFGISDPLACSEEEERRRLLTADVIIAIQSREERLLRELVPEREVILAGMDFDVAGSEVSDTVRDSIAVVASDNALNVHGFGEFLSKCWPTIKTAWPAATLHVVGKVGDTCRIDDPSIRYSGWIDDLDKVYEEASIVINPTIAGTGLKIKSVQALAHGKPLVAWTNGVEGLDYHGEPPFRECTSWTAFSDAVVSLLRSDEERHSLERLALAYAQSEFGAERVYAQLKSRLDGASPGDQPTIDGHDVARRGETAVR